MFDSNWVYQRKIRQFDNLTSEVLDLKGVKNQDAFLNPNVKDMINPFLMNDMEKAVDRILESIENGEKIFIYGDYDADGLTSAAILARFLGSIDAKVEVFIPDRFDDGYGLNIDSLKKVVKQGAKLVITTDCGINSINESLYLRENNVDLIITDHHASLGNLPIACAVVCCTRKDNSYPFISLSGAGVAYKLTNALSQVIGIEETDKNLMALAALGTVTDIVPLTGENRIIVKQGMKAIKTGSNCGIEAILENSGVKKENLTSYTLGFVIGPRINAAGRMGNADIALELLLTDDYINAREISDRLSKMNNNRKKEQSRIQDLVIEDIKHNPSILECPVIVSGRNDFNKGVVGIVASKISEIYHRPAIILSCAEGIAEGSGRSKGDFSLINALEHCKDLLTGYGGHRNAAGLSLEQSNIGKFRDRLTEYAKTIEYSDEIKRQVDISFALRSEEIDFSNVTEMEKLEPFGNGNPKPVFSLQNAKLTDLRKIGSGKNHLNLGFKIDNNFFKAICFNSVFYEPLLHLGGQYDIAFKLGINEFRDKKSVQLQITDINFPDSKMISIGLMIVRLLVHMIKYEKANAAIVDIEDFISRLYLYGMPFAAAILSAETKLFRITRSEIGDIFRLLKEKGNGEAFSIKDNESELSIIKQYVSIEILMELGIFKLSPKGMYKYIVFSHEKEKKSLDDSKLFRILGIREN